MILLSWVATYEFIYYNNKKSPVDYHVYLDSLDDNDASTCIDYLGTNVREIVSMMGWEDSSLVDAESMGSNLV